jgi:Coenzyme PQQ synthesis protein D (PqqD)
MSQTNPTPYDHIVFTEFDGTEGILVDLNTKRYYQLNETAMLIWKSLEKGLAPSAIADQIVASYEVTPEAALQNVEQTLKDFETYRLIGIQERNGSSRARP